VVDKVVEEDGGGILFPFLSTQGFLSKTETELRVADHGVVLQLPVGENHIQVNLTVLQSENKAAAGPVACVTVSSELPAPAILKLPHNICETENIEVRYKATDSDEWTTILPNDTDVSIKEDHVVVKTNHFSWWCVFSKCTPYRIKLWSYCFQYKQEPLFHMFACPNSSRGQIDPTQRRWWKSNALPEYPNLDPENDFHCIGDRSLGMPWSDDIYKVHVIEGNQFDGGNLVIENISMIAAENHFQVRCSDSGLATGACAVGFQSINNDDTLFLHSISSSLSSSSSSSSSSGAETKTDDIYDLFLSHKKNDDNSEVAIRMKNLARLVCEHFKSDGLHCFLDKYYIGNSWNALPDLVASSKTVLIMLSETFVESPWCILELLSAVMHERPIAFFRISDAFKYRAFRTQLVNIGFPFVDALDEYNIELV